MFCWISEPEKQHRLCLLPTTGQNLLLLPSVPLLRLNGTERKRGKGNQRRSLHSIKNCVCVLLSAQTLLLPSQPEKHLRFVVPTSPPANRCLAIAVCPCSCGFLLHRSCADEPRCEMVPVLSSTSGRRTLLCNFPALHLSASLPGPFSGLHRNDFLGTQSELRLQ